MRHGSWPRAPGRQWGRPAGAPGCGTWEDDALLPVVILVKHVFAKCSLCQAALARQQAVQPVYLGSNCRRVRHRAPSAYYEVGAKAVRFYSVLSSRVDTVSATSTASLLTGAQKHNKPRASMNAAIGARSSSAPPGRFRLSHLEALRLTPPDRVLRVPPPAVVDAWPPARLLGAGSMPDGPGPFRCLDGTGRTTVRAARNTLPTHTTWCQSAGAGHVLPPV